jgi:hypothetical protein
MKRAAETQQQATEKGYRIHTCPIGSILAFCAMWSPVSP